MRYYFETVFSVEYFPYWEFSMLMILGLLCSILWRLSRIEKIIIKQNITNNNKGVGYGMSKMQ